MGRFSIAATAILSLYGMVSALPQGRACGSSGSNLMGDGMNVVKFAGEQSVHDFSNNQNCKNGVATLRSRDTTVTAPPPPPTFAPTLADVESEPSTGPSSALSGLLGGLGSLFGGRSAGGSSGSGSSPLSGLISGFGNLLSGAGSGSRPYAPPRPAPQPAPRPRPAPTPSIPLEPIEPVEPIEPEFAEQEAAPIQQLPPIGGVPGYASPEYAPPFPPNPVPYYGEDASGEVAPTTPLSGILNGLQDLLGDSGAGAVANPLAQIIGGLQGLLEMSGGESDINSVTIERGEPVFEEGETIAIIPRTSEDYYYSDEGYDIAEESDD